MTDIEFQMLREAQLDIMDEVHKVCCENNIKYYMIGGTLLGAVRHKGFIPWDPDIDIAMERSEYIRFKEIFSGCADKRYCYRDLKNTKEFAHPHALVCIKDTLLYSKYDELNPKMENLGVYLDVFPLDHAPEDSVLAKKQADKLNRIKWFKYFRIPYTYSVSKLKNLMRLAFRILFCFISIDKINEVQQKEMQRYNAADTPYLCSMSSHYSYKKQYMPKEIYGEPILMEFEGRSYYAPALWDDYLKRIFKDYMKLPPKSERQENKETFTRLVMDK